MPRGPLALLVACALGAEPSASGIRHWAFQSQPVLKSETAIVEVDAIVTDRSGRFIRDLRLDEIQVFEDGRPQRLQALYLVDAGMAAEVRDPAAGLSSTPDSSRSIRRSFFLLFDQEHLTPGSLNRVRSGAESFLASDFRDGQDLAGMYAIGGTSQVRMTTSREELLAAVKKIKPRSDVTSRLADLRQWPRLLGEVEASRIDKGDTTVLNMAIARACEEQRTPNCAADAELELQSKAKRHMREADAAVNRSLQALSIAAKSLSALEGRKTLVFLTDGFMADTHRGQLRVVSGDAGRAGVAIYVVDARGLDKTAAGRSIQDGAASGDTFAAAAFDTTDDSSDQLADATGGLVVRNVNNGQQALAAIAKDSGTYYVIGYVPDKPEPDGRFRSIEVRVARDGVVTRARRGYVASPRTAPLIAVAPGSSPAPGTSPAPATPTHEAPGTRHEAPVLASTSLSPIADLPSGRPRASDNVRLLIEQAPPDTSTRLKPHAGTEAAERGWARYEKGDLEGAAEELAGAVASPDAPLWARYALGQAAFGLRRFQDAVTQWEQVRQAAPAFQPVYFDLVDGYLQVDRPRDAIAVLRDAERRWPDEPEIFNALGVVQARRKSYGDAVTSFERAVKADPANAVAYFNLGRVHEIRYAMSRRYISTSGGWVANAGERNAAIDNYKKYLELGGPFEQSAREGLARLGWK
jgi:VWFA-related protein